MRFGTVAASLGAALVALSAPAVAGAVTPNDVVVSADPADWTPNVLDGQVKAIAKIGNTMYVGGLFTTVKEPGGADTPRSNIFAFDATTGAIDPNFAPTLDREVDTLAAAPDGGLFVGGRFNTVNGIATSSVPPPGSFTSCCAVTAASIVPAAVPFAAVTFPCSVAGAVRAPLSGSREMLPTLVPPGTLSTTVALYATPLPLTIGGQLFIT